MSDDPPDDIPVLPDEVYNPDTNNFEKASSDRNPVDDLLRSDPLKLTQSEAMMVHSISDGKSKQDEIENDTVQPVGLYEDLSQEDYDYAIKEAHRILTEKDAFNEEKNLEKDLLILPEQNYCVVNWVGPTFRAKTDICGFRIMGAFKTLEKAQKYAQRLHGIDPTYDVGIMEMYLWCLGYPDQSDVIIGSDGEMDTKAMEVQRDHALNEFIIKHKTKLEETKQLFEVRKRAIRKSKITKEGSEEDAPIKEVPKGVPTEEMKEIHAKEMEKWLGDVKKKEIDDDDYEPGKRMLDFETIYKLPNQEYAVVSFIGYTGNNQRIPICIKGIYGSEQEAKERVKQLIYVDDTYDIVPMPLYKWVPCDPDLTSIRQEYKDRSLNNLIDTAEKQEQETLSFHQVRKKYVPAAAEDESCTTKDKEFEYNLNNLKPVNITFQDPIVEEPVGEDTIVEGGGEEGQRSFILKQGEENSGEITGATEALVEVENQDSRDIWMKGRVFYEKGEEEGTKEEVVERFTLSQDKDIKQPMFKKADDEIKELEEKVQNLMATEGIDEKEAREKFRLKLDVHKAKVHELDEDDLAPKPKPKTKGTDFESMGQIIERLKKEGKTAAEIRKIMSSGPSE